MWHWRGCAAAHVPVHGRWTAPQVPSGLHVRVGLPVYVSVHDVTVTLTAVAAAAVIGHDA
jgi:hypothetical protein